MARTAAQSLEPDTAAPDLDPQTAVDARDLPVVDELIEDVSIDGMCGVY